MSNKNVKVKVRILGLVEEFRDKSDTAQRPGSNKASQKNVRIDVPVVAMPASEWAQRLADAAEVLQYGNDLDNDKPVVAVTYPATGVVHNLADLSGAVWLPQLIETTVTFEYGLTPALGSSSAALGSPTSDAGPTTLTATLAGLTPNKKYYFRIKAVNATKTVYGFILSFHTTVAP